MLSLIHIYVVLLLVGTNLAANAHTFSQKIHQLVVALVNLTAQLVQNLCRIMLIAHYADCLLYTSDATPGGVLANR